MYNMEVEPRKHGAIFFWSPKPYIYLSSPCPHGLLNLWRTLFIWHFALSFNKNFMVHHEFCKRVIQTPSCINLLLSGKIHETKNFNHEPDFWPELTKKWARLYWSFSKIPFHHKQTYSEEKEEGSSTRSLCRWKIRFFVLSNPRINPSPDRKKSWKRICSDDSKYDIVSSNEPRKSDFLIEIRILKYSRFQRSIEERGSTEYCEKTPNSC